MDGCAGARRSGLIAHLRDHGNEYDAVMFLPYLYATTVRGLPHVRDRSVLVPALHDEPWLDLEIFRPVIERARALVFSTPEERELARVPLRDRCDSGAPSSGRVSTRHRRSTLRRSRRLTGLRRPYVVCVGRIDPSKGAHSPDRVPPGAAEGRLPTDRIWSCSARPR